MQVQYAETPEPKKNQQPERQVVQECLIWLKTHQFDVTVVEAKAVFSRARNAYFNSHAEPGFPDIVGNDQNGIACYIEVKRQGMRRNLSDRQKAFLRRKVDTGCFAVCVDSVVLLERLYKFWSELESLKDRQSLLIRELITSKKRGAPEIR